MRFYLVAILSFTLIGIQGQILTGNVVDSKNNAIQGATLYWMFSSDGTSTSDNGFFRLERKPEHQFLITNFTGYQPDTTEVAPNELYIIIRLQEGLMLQTVNIQAERNSNSFSRLEPLNIESLEKKEFKKAACCSLSESFQTSNAVDVSYSNAVTGTKEIQFLGLRGLYTQFLIENRTAFDGILSTMGYDLIPGTWLDQVNILKGASSALHGSQSMAGAINVQLKKPDTDHPVYLNLFGDLHGRLESNLHLNKKWNDRKASGLYLNATTNASSRDHNEDSFQDEPKVNKVNGLIRNTFYSESFEGQLNAQVLNERRTSGQLNVESPYTIKQDIQHYNAFGNLGYVKFNKELQSLGSLYDVSYSQIDSKFGNRSFKADETRVSAQFFYMHPFKEGKHMLIFGPVFHLNRAHETWDQNKLTYKETTTAAVADYTYRNNIELNNSLTITTSQRLEWLNSDQLLYIPRANFRLLFANDWTARASVGRGYRFPRIFSNQSGLFASAKLWNLESTPEIETSWNTGLNLVGKPYWLGRELVINFDLYYTWFQNQLVVDQDESDSRIYIYGLDGKSYALQSIITLSYPIADRIQLKIGGKFTESKTKFKKGILENLLIPKYRGLVSIDFESENRKWLCNLTTSYIGKMRLAEKTNIPVHLIHEHQDQSTDYVLMQSQINYTHKAFEFYAGVENILNYTQHEAIIDPENPFGTYFNATEIFAPVSGIKPYLGIKWHL
ncbi:MAG: TonB-dependent receptor [Saprospiraceae bacterium]|nr:TonB-dependent receptor [Saprospiraceae bacterium]MBK8296433.1 TonB-dependent receptor [Saprospiraceae bacterium]